MSELKRKFLDRVIIVRDGSTSDGLHGLVTQIVEDSKTPLTVLLWATQGFKHTNYYRPEDVELTDEKWSDSLPCDQQVRCVFDRWYSRCYYICDGKGRGLIGYGTPGIAWSHYFKEHTDDASAALHTLIEEVENDTSASPMENRQEANATVGCYGNARIDGHLAEVREGSEYAESGEDGKAPQTHRRHTRANGAGKRVTTKQTGGDR